MPKKKVVLIFVEGISDERALSSISKFVRDVYDIHIHFTNGDVFTKRAEKQVKAMIGDEIKKVLNERKYAKNDLLAVIHITDTDGVFINDEFVVVDESIIGDAILYTEDVIKVPSQVKATQIKQRNRDKARKLKMMSNASEINNLPYFLLYFSCNLDHVIHNDSNLQESLKTSKAREFNNKFKEKTSEFYDFFNHNSFVVPGTAKETWAFIEKDLNSLRRNSNFRLIFSILASLARPPE